MTSATVLSPNALDFSVLATSYPESELQIALREETIAKIKHHEMMTTPSQAQFLMFMIERFGVRRAIEVGVFTGYGTLAMAQALPEEGLLIACDKNIAWPSIGQPYWQRAGVGHKIDLQIAPAAQSLQLLLDEGHAKTFDFIFIDADKIHYPDYFSFSHRLLRPGGLIVLDNVTWVGQQRVSDQQVPATQEIARLLASIIEREDYQCQLIPIAKGMLLAELQGYNKD
jgi:predicted O-methyltransferase YrrM